MSRIKPFRAMGVTAIATAVGGFILGVALILALPSANADTDPTPPPPNPTPTFNPGNFTDAEIQKICKTLQIEIYDPERGVPETTLYWEAVYPNGYPYYPGPHGLPLLFDVDIRNAAAGQDKSAWEPVIHDYQDNYFILVTGDGTWEFRIAVAGVFDGHQNRRCTTDANRWSYLILTYPPPAQATLNPEHIELTNQAVRCAYNQLTDGITRANKATFHPFITDLVHGAVNSTESTDELTLFVLAICNSSLPDQIVLEMLLEGNRWR